VRSAHFLPNEKGVPAKGKFPADGISPVAKLKKSARQTILLDSIPPNLATLQLLKVVCGSIVQQDSWQEWVDNWNG